jgi:hypothetical protein
VYPTEAGPGRDTAGRAHDAIGGGGVTVDDEREDRPAARRQLAGGDRVGGGGVVDGSHRGVPGEASGQLGGRRRLPFDPDGQRLQAPAGQPRLHRAGDGPGQGAPVADPFQQPGVPRGHGAQDDVGVAGRGLGQRGHGRIGAEIEGPLQHGGGQRVVDDEQTTGIVGRGGQRFEVDDPEQRVGGGLHPQQRPFRHQ